MDEIVKIIAILGAASLVGNWYLAETKKKRARGEPWFSPYLTLPGLIAIAAIILIPTIFWFVSR
ncbi:MAG: hypothetical protein ABII68_04025 [Pseudomonadota bacterium]